MGPVKQTNGGSIPHVELFPYLPGFDIAQLFRMAAQDDGTLEGGNGGKILTKDINGNPAELEGSQQMREAHQLDEKGTVVSFGGRPGSSGANNHEMGHTQGEDFAGANSRNRRARRNKRNARQQGVEVHPDEDESYVGDVSDVDDLVKYINNDISAEKVKKKERNKVKTSETSSARGSFEASDVCRTSSQSEGSSAKQVESKEAGGNLDDKDRKEMGNLSFAEKLDTKEDGADEPPSKVIPTEPDTKNKKTPKSDMPKHESETKNKKTPKSDLPKHEQKTPKSDLPKHEQKTPKNDLPKHEQKAPESDIPKHESSKTLKNHVVPSSKPPAKPERSAAADDKTQAKDSDAEVAAKGKSGKKGKAKPVKRDSQEPQARVRSPSPPPPPAPPATYSMQLDGTESATQGQWCTVVSQKKKRSQAQASPAVQNCTATAPTHQTRSKDAQTPSSPYCSKDPQRRGGQQQHAVSQHSSVRASGKREKDLSPSNFPSLENVFDMGGRISDKDSDRESSKSFPADLGLAGRCRTTFPISYASMASGNAAHESVDSSKAESVSSSVEDSNLEYSASPTSLKWKGSPQERRHSIGSAPKELSKNVLQRTGSQDMLHCDKDLRNPSVTIPNKLSNASSKNLVPSDSTGSFTSSGADSARGSEVGSEGTGEDFTAAPVDSSSKSLSGMSGDTKKAPVHAEERLTDVISAESEKTKTTKLIPVESAQSSSGTVKSESKASSSGAKQANGGRNKGVVFCCSGDGADPPGNLDVQFGFLPGEEEASGVFGSVSAEPSVVPVSCGVEISQSATVDSVSMVHSTSTSGSSSLSSPPQQLPSTAAATLGDPTVKPPKGPHIERRNGFISSLSDSRHVSVLQTSANSSIIIEQTPAQVESTTGSGSPCSNSASNVSREAAGSSIEPEGEESQDAGRKFTYGSELTSKSPRNAVYIRPPEEIATSEISQDYFVSFAYLGANWEWNDTNHWRKKV